jgi:uncharacterized protein (DUF433 family)
MKDESHNIPFQVQNLIDNMLSKTERDHIRDNYRVRLESIRDAIDLSLRKYKNDDMMHSHIKRNRA